MKMLAVQPESCLSHANVGEQGMRENKAWERLMVEGNAERWIQEAFQEFLQ